MFPNQEVSNRQRREKNKIEATIYTAGIQLKEDAPLLEVTDLKKHFPIKGGIFQKTVGQIKAVEGISFTAKKGETIGLVGESGCGKSTAGRTILRLLNKTAGTIKFKGVNLHALKRDQMRKLRPKMQMVFQDPFSSLNPRIRIGEAISESLVDHGIANKTQARERAKEILEICGLASYHYDRYPHQFSGGQRQRVGIARSLILQPEFLVLDEPISALDVSIQAQIINLLGDLQQQNELTYLFISHDLSVVEHLSKFVGVMYLGSLVEYGTRDQLFKSPLHPYTIALLSAIPIPDPTRKRDRIVLKGDLPNPANQPKGCKFHTRCPFAKEICHEEVPAFDEVGNGHKVACHFVGDFSL